MGVKTMIRHLFIVCCLGLAVSGKKIFDHIILIDIQYFVLDKQFISHRKEIYSKCNYMLLQKCCSSSPTPDYLKDCLITRYQNVKRNMHNHVN